MKLAGAKAKSYLSSKQPAALTLVFGENAARTRQTLRDFLNQYLGENAAEDMRISQLDARECQKDPAQIIDAMRAVSFFPGPRGVVIFDATDALAPHLELALEDYSDQDAKIFVQAGNLKANSKLRKALESNPQAAAIGLYEDPLTPVEIQEMVATQNIKLSKDALELLIAFTASYDRNAIPPLLGTISLYQGQAEAPLTADELQQLLPGKNSQTADEIVNAIFRGDAKRLVAEIRRTPAQGISLAEINMRAIWRAKLIYELKSASNPSQAMQGLRPPLFGARRQAVENNLRTWSLRNAELALDALWEAEKEIRSGRLFLPERAYLERIFLRVTRFAR